MCFYITSGWLGEIDEWSLHGGCQVLKGKKWIANMWLTAPYAKDKDIMSMYTVESMEREREQEEQQM